MIKGNMISIRGSPPQIILKIVLILVSVTQQEIIPKTSGIIPTRRKFVYNSNWPNQFLENNATKTEMFTNPSSINCGIIE
jgi:hypothetical protein